MDNDSAPRPAPTLRHAFEPGLLLTSVLLVAVIAVFYFEREWFVPQAGSHDAAPRTRCLNNIRNLGLGLINYAAGNNGVLPPAWNVDKQGQPLQSWRLSVVGYLDEPAISRAYHNDEPWNSPFNSQFAERELSVMRCPEDISRTTDTSYMVVVGPRTAFPGAKPRKLKEIEDHDGLANTLMIVETSDSGVNWTKPRDIQFDDALRGINIPGVLTLSSRHNGAVMVSFADGHALPLSEKTDPAVLKQLLQINDGGPK
jgi:prepilin-type processing-associated H-X9-DG protein